MACCRRAGYTIDPDTEEVVSPAGWYSPFFATMKTPLIGTKYKGVREVRTEHRSECQGPSPSRTAQHICRLPLLVLQ